MERTCIVVADGKRARFFALGASDSPRHPLQLMEESVLVNPDIEGARRDGAGRVKPERLSNRQAGPVHPFGARRERHRLELERRFGCEIASQAGKITGPWMSGTVLMIAPPRLLGMVRGALRESLHSGIELKELAKDYTRLSAAELRDQLTVLARV